MENRLYGKRFVALSRCSTPGQADTSINAQNALLDAFARENGMECVGTVELAGVSGSVPGLRTDIEALIQRKKEHDDFDVVLLQDATRFTRSGPVHGMKILGDLRDAGIEVVFVKDNLPNNDLGDVMRGLQFYAGKEQVRSLSHAVARGASASLNEGRSAHCKAPPYGVDRLYTSEDGTPKHIIRNLADGTQVKLDLHSGATIETFGPNAKAGMPDHYIKQKTERIELVPGDPAHVGIVREIFQRRHCEKWGYWKIARNLNERGVPAPRGGEWYLNTVRTILLNSIYLGTGLANLSTAAIYYMRGHSGPVESELDGRDLNHGRPPLRIRPTKDWVKRNEIHLTNFLDESVRLAAHEKQQARLDALAARRSQPRNRDRHRDSSYFLKGILTAKQTGQPMTGRKSGRAPYNKRYYAISKAFAAPTKDSVLRRRIAADPLESAILAAFQSVLRDTEHVRKVVSEVVERELRIENKTGKGLEALNAERAAIQRKFNFVIEELDDIGRDAVKQKTQAYQTRLNEIDQENRRAGMGPQALGDAGEIVEAVCRRLGSLADEVGEMLPPALHSVLQHFVSKLVADLETKDVQVEFTVPDWSKMGHETMCLVTNSAYKIGNEAHHPQGQPLVILILRWDGATKRYCTVHPTAAA